MITKEQEEEFKRRKAAGPKLSLAEVEEFNKNKPTLTKKQYKSFLNATDEKLNGNS